MPQQDPVPLMAKFGTLDSLIVKRVLLVRLGDMLGRPTPLYVKLSTACKSVTAAAASVVVLLGAKPDSALMLQGPRIHSFKLNFAYLADDAHALLYIYD